MLEKENHNFSIFNLKKKKKKKSLVQMILKSKPSEGSNQQNTFKPCFFDMICLKANQLFMGYSILKFDSFINV